MGATLPAAGYVSDNARTTLERKNHDEDIVAILKRMPGVGEAAEVVTISTGNMTPAKGIIQVNGEGSASDVLDTISVANYANGSIIILVPFIGGNTITITHNAGGSGTINLASGVDFAMTGARSVWLRLVGTAWQEVYRGYGADFAAFRSFIGLGTAAVANVGPGNGLDADTVDGQHATAFLGAAAQAADSAQLGGVAASDYVRKSLAALQTLAHNLAVSEGRVYIDNGLGETSGVEMQIGGTTVARLVVDDQATDRLLLEILSGGIPVSTLRLSANGAIEFSDDDGATWGALWHTANDGAASGLDADLVHGENGASVFGDGGMAEYSESVSRSVGEVWTITVPSKMSFAPRAVAGLAGGITFSAEATGSEASTRWRVTNGSGFAQTINVYIRYIAGNPPLNS